MDEVAQLSADTSRVKALGIIIATLSIEQTSANASGNVNVSETTPCQGFYAYVCCVAGKRSDPGRD